MNEVESVRVTTAVDNNVWKEGLASSWGLSFYVEAFTGNKKHIVLMDTSGSFQIFFRNASKLGLNLSKIEAILISHWHGDHCGALSQVLSLLKPQTMIYVPSENSFGLGEIRGAGGIPWICHKPIEFVDGMMSTGEVPSGLSEHSLLINIKNKGLVILVGCSHPGIINILKRAQKVSGIDKIHAVIGGFHISSVGEGMRVGKFLRELDVKLVSPCHCTSNDAKQEIAKILGERCVNNGSGKIISID
ncbi:MBL fold metallo-hydrolase [Candidatus Bathyarchaeota archaeon]|nr:MBL fold metallo-hydrolase [Candidatus Bathyarchaeota archaeon]